MAIQTYVVTNVSGALASPGTYKYRQEIEGRRQKPFVNKRMPLFYSVREWRFESQRSWGFKNLKSLDASALVWQQREIMTASLYKSSGSPQAFAVKYSQAYEKLRSRMQSDSADLLSLIRERREAARMINDRLQQLTLMAGKSREWAGAANKYKNPATRSRVKKKLVSDIASAFSVPPSRVKRHFDKKKHSEIFTTPAELILELRWGWMPLVSDLYNALKFLDTVVYNQPIWGSAEGPIVVDRTTKSGYESTTQITEARYIVKVGGNLVVTANNLHQLERLGMTNLAQTFWETTPYSWLIDYFSNVGVVLSALDDGLSATLTDVYVSRKISGVEHVRYEDKNWERGHEFSRSFRGFTRQVPKSLPIPDFTLTPLDITPWRLATAVSLLVLKLVGAKTPLKTSK